MPIGLFYLPGIAKTFILLSLNEDSKDFAYKLELDPTACALSGGEDYELLFTISQADHENITKNNGLSIIGHITEAS